MTDKPYPFTEEQEAWLKDLETTTEPQTEGHLHVKKGNHKHKVGFCCLGRACVTLGLRSDRAGYLITYEGMDNVLPDSAVNRLHLNCDEGGFKRSSIIDGTNFHSLVDMNDRGKAFKEIAAYIRANPWNVFVDPETENEEEQL